jgi:hypothetical protein
MQLVHFALCAWLGLRYWRTNTEVGGDGGPESLRRLPTLRDGRLMKAIKVLWPSMRYVHVISSHLEGGRLTAVQRTMLPTRHSEPWKAFSIAILVFPTVFSTMRRHV